MNVCDGERQRAVRACLPRLDAHVEHLRNIAWTLECSGVDVCLEREAGDRLEVRVGFTLAGMQLEGAFDLAQWCALQFEDGDRLAFGEIDPAYLLPMFESEANSTLCRLGDLSVSEWRALDIRSSNRTGPSLRVGTCLGWPALRITDWPSASCPRGTRGPPWHAAFDPVPITLALLVGRSRVTPRLMRRLERGDVLLVQCRDWQVRVEEAVLGMFSVSRRGWKMETFEKLRRNSDRFPPARAVAAGEKKALDAIPVEAEFLLASHTLSLAELRELRTGDTFALARHPLLHAQPAGTSQTTQPEGAPGQTPGETTPGENGPPQGYLIEIRINGLPVAQGELVALGDQLAVQVVQLGHRAHEG
jgi:flagellar motor switch/type III secretory pathway protein FliN